MTPKQKAYQIMQSFTDTIFSSGNIVSKPMVKACAIVCVNEIILGVKRIIGDEEYMWSEHQNDEINDWKQVLIIIQNS